MNVEINWTQGMQLQVTNGAATALMDAKSPIGKGDGLTPKELVAAGIGGCTAMDVLALLKKHKQPVESFKIQVDTESTTGAPPAVFTSAKIRFELEGAIDPKVLNEAVTLSQTKYCGVSAMLSKAFPISYITLLNGQEIGRGEAQF
jgi:putative redox protein